MANNRQITSAVSQYRGDCRFTKIFDAAKLESEVDAYLRSVLAGAPISLIVSKDAEKVKPADASKSQIEKINAELKRAKDAYLSGVFDKVWRKTKKY